MPLDPAICGLTLLAGAPVTVLGPAAAPALDTAVEGKPLLGEGLGELLLSENFAATWEPDTVDLQDAEATLQVLESAWTALIEEQGWPEPPGSEWRLWVQLEPGLAANGLTVLAEADGAPDGVALIRLDPDASPSRDFLDHVAAHELVHAIQYGLRELSAPEEAWYWEASAEWGASRALPGNMSWTGQVRHYVQSAELRYSTTDGAREYGLSALNDWHGRIFEVWMRGAEQPEQSWERVLAEELGAEPAPMWAAFASALANDELSVDYEDFPLLEGPPAEGALPWLGVHVYEAGRRLWVSTSDAVVLGAPSGTGERVQVEPGERLVVVGGSESTTRYSLEVEAEQPQGCACGGVGGRFPASWLLLVAPWLRRRPCSG